VQQFVTLESDDQSFFLFVWKRSAWRASQQSYGRHWDSRASEGPPQLSPWMCVNGADRRRLPEKSL